MKSSQEPGKHSDVYSKYLERPTKSSSSLLDSKLSSGDEGDGDDNHPNKRRLELQGAANASKRARLQQSYNMVPFFSEDYQAYEGISTASLIQTALRVTGTMAMQALGLGGSFSSRTAQRRSEMPYYSTDGEDANSHIQILPLPENVVPDAKVEAIENEGDAFTAAREKTGGKEDASLKELNHELRHVPVGGLMFMPGGPAAKDGREKLRRFWLEATETTNALERERCRLSTALKSCPFSCSYVAPDPSLFPKDAARPLWTPIDEDHQFAYPDAFQTPLPVDWKEREKIPDAVIAGSLPHINTTAEFIASNGLLGFFDKGRKLISSVTFSDEIITAVSSVNVVSGVFKPLVKCALVVATDKNVRVFPYIPEDISKDGERIDDWLKISPSHSVKVTSGEHFNQIVSTSLGRIFLCADNSDSLYELYYDVRRRARFVRHALTFSGSLPAIGPLLSTIQEYTGFADHIAKLSVDTSRCLLYVLTEGSSVYVIDVAGFGTRYLHVVGTVNDMAKLQQSMYPQLPLLDASVQPSGIVLNTLRNEFIKHHPGDEKIKHLNSSTLLWRYISSFKSYVPRMVVHIEPIPLSQDPELAFVAFTNVGCRLYFQMQGLRLLSARGPPPDVFNYPFDHVTAVASKNNCSLMGVASLTRQDSYYLISLVHTQIGGAEPVVQLNQGDGKTNPLSSEVFRELVESVPLKEPISSICVREIPSSLRATIPKRIQEASRIRGTVHGLIGEEVTCPIEDTYDDALSSELGDIRVMFTLYSQHVAADLVKKTVSDVIISLLGTSNGVLQQRKCIAQLLGCYSPVFRYHILLNTMCSSPAGQVRDLLAMMLAALSKHRSILLDFASSSFASTSFDGSSSFLFADDERSYISYDDLMNKKDSDFDEETGTRDDRFSPKTASLIQRSSGALINWKTFPQGVMYMINHTLHPLLAAPLFNSFYDPCTKTAKLVLAWDTEQLDKLITNLRTILSCVKDSRFSEWTGIPQHIFTLMDQFWKISPSLQKRRQARQLSVYIEVLIMLLEKVIQCLCFVGLLLRSPYTWILSMVPPNLRCFLGNCELSQLLESERGVACLSILMALYVRVQVRSGFDLRDTLDDLHKSCPLFCTDECLLFHVALYQDMHEGCELLSRQLVQRSVDELCLVPFLSVRDLLYIISVLDKSPGGTGIRLRILLLRGQSRARTQHKWISKVAMERHQHIACTLLCEAVGEVLSTLPTDKHYGNLANMPVLAARESEISRFIKEMLSSSDKDDPWPKILVKWLDSRGYCRFFLGLDNSVVKEVVQNLPSCHDLLPRHYDLLGLHLQSAEAYIDAAECMELRSLKLRRLDVECAFGQLDLADKSVCGPAEKKCLSDLRFKAKRLRFSLDIQSKTIERMPPPVPNDLNEHHLPLMDIKEKVVNPHHMYDLLLRILVYERADDGELQNVCRRALQSNPSDARTTIRELYDALQSNGSRTGAFPISFCASELERWAIGKGEKEEISGEFLIKLGIPYDHLFSGLHEAAMQEPDPTLSCRLVLSLLDVLDDWMNRFTAENSSPPWSLLLQPQTLDPLPLISRYPSPFTSEVRNKLRDIHVDPKCGSDVTNRLDASLRLFDGLSNGITAGTRR